MTEDRTQTEVQETYDYLFGEASKVLDLGGSFAPFGAAIRQGGERTHMNVDLPTGTSNPQDHIAGLIRAFRQEAEQGKISVAGLAFDGKVTVDGQRADALIIHIEHLDGGGVQIFVPYLRIDGPKKLNFLDPIVQNIEPEIFQAAA